jgi:hypothetical protein
MARRKKKGRYYWTRKEKVTNQLDVRNLSRFNLGGNAFKLNDKIKKDVKPVQ